MPRFDTFARGRLLLLERLEDRAVPAVVASFDAATKTLTVLGDNLNNAIGVFRDAGGIVRVSNNGVGVAITGGAPAAANTTLIRVLAQGGNDVVTLNEVNGALPKANLFGGTGNDTLTGGSGNDQLFGGGGDDRLTGRGGADAIRGEADNDRMIWNNGDGSDVNEGGDGTDTAEVTSGSADDSFTAGPDGSRVKLERSGTAPFSIDIGTTENLVADLGGGNDSFFGGAVASLISLDIDGGTGNDTLRGGNGADILRGGDGEDFIDGNAGNDVAFMGAGNDVFQWDPGDGSDIVEGQAGIDGMTFNGSAGSEIFAASANGGRAVFTRNIGNIIMDLDDVERIDLFALGGADSATVNDLTGTDLTAVNINLGGADAVNDTVNVNGTAGDDLVGLAGTAAGTTVTGLFAKVTISGTEAGTDRLVVNGLAGDDVISATALTSAAIALTANGGADDDVLIGGEGVDILDGGADTDVLIGGPATDTLTNGETVVQ